MTELKRDSFIPLYHQLKEWMRLNIQNGGWKPGEAILSERELSEQFSISRMTVRQAVTELVSEGLLYRQKGKGTFVAHPKIEKDLEAFTSFSQDMMERGIIPGSRVHSFDVESTPVEIIEDLSEHVGGVYHLFRIRLADQIPIVIEHVYIPFNRFPGLKKFDFSVLSLHDVLRRNYSVKMGFSRQSIKVKKLTSEESRMLEVKSGVGLLITRKTYDHCRKLVEYTHSLYHPDRYEYLSTLYPRGE